MGPDGKQDFVMAVSKYKKADIVDLICERTSASRKEIRIIVDLFIDEIKTALKQNRVIELRGFGTFEIKIRKGRLKARNPKTGKSVAVNSHGIAAFRPGLELKKAVWDLPPGENSAGPAEDTTGLVKDVPPVDGADTGEQ
jgi:integration host factor subunit beta